jgi:hypothetical protein
MYLSSQYQVDRLRLGFLNADSDFQFNIWVSDLDTNSSSNLTDTDFM